MYGSVKYSIFSALNRPIIQGFYFSIPMPLFEPRSTLTLSVVSVVRCRAGGGGGVHGGGDRWPVG
jgi:hypothetical protein